MRRIFFYPQTRIQHANSTNRWDTCSQPSASLKQRDHQAPLCFALANDECIRAISTEISICYLDDGVMARADPSAIVRACVETHLNPSQWR